MTHHFELYIAASAGAWSIVNFDEEKNVNNIAIIIIYLSDSRKKKNICRHFLKKKCEVTLAW